MISDSILCSIDLINIFMIYLRKVSVTSSEVPVIRNKTSQGSVELLVFGGESIFGESLKKIFKVQHLQGW